MTRTWPMVPGVPSAGHLTGRGFWHPGPAEGCTKCEPPAQPKRPTKKKES